jgi:hypothetical protein
VIGRIAELLIAASFVVVTMVGTAIAQSDPQCPTTLPAGVPFAVNTYHYDNFRTGWNCNETTLTPANVATRPATVTNPAAILAETGFGLIQIVTLDDPVNDLVKAQPLFVPNVKIPPSGENLTLDTLATQSKPAETLACSRYHLLRSHH